MIPVILVARWLPVGRFAFVRYGAGLTAMRAGAFLLAVTTGTIPMTGLYPAVGGPLTTAPPPRRSADSSSRGWSYCCRS